MKRRIFAAAVGIAVASATSLPLASRADPTDGPCDQARAGNPREVSHFAMPSDTGRYIGYWIGGGCAVRHKADCPNIDEGTWGWDYTGGFFQRRVDLGWWHGRRYQGGVGAYKTEGPRLLEAE
jgi:hypothetical protein